MHLDDLDEVRRQALFPSRRVESRIEADQYGDERIDRSPHEIILEGQSHDCRKPTAVKLHPVGPDKNNQHA